MNRPLNPLLIEYEKAGKEYAESMKKVMDYIEELATSRQALKEASEALKKNPGCTDLQCTVSRLQADISRLSSDSDQEERKFNDLSLEFVKARRLLLERRCSLIKHHVDTKPTESQRPGMCKQQMHCFV